MVSTETKQEQREHPIEPTTKVLVLVDIHDLSGHYKETITENKGSPPKREVKQGMPSLSRATTLDMRKTKKELIKFGFCEYRGDYYSLRNNVTWKRIIGVE